MTCESHTNSLLIVNFLSFSQLFSSSENQNEQKKSENLNHVVRSTRVLPRICACFMTQFASQRKNITGFEMKYGGLSELHCKVNMERTTYSDTTAGEKMAFKRFFNFQFMSSAVYGAWMKKGTCKAADKLLTGNHVKSSRQLVRKTFTDFKHGLTDTLNHFFLCFLLFLVAKQV